MIISLCGLDLSFMKDSPLPPSPPKERIDWRAKRAVGIAAPYFMPDIAPFVSVATRDETPISSRSELRAYEKRHNIRQVGDAWGNGEIVAENRAKKEREEQLAAKHMAEVEKLSGEKPGWQTTP
jgi:hypothetical protein